MCEGERVCLAKDIVYLCKRERERGREGERERERERERGGRRGRERGSYNL